MNIQLKQQESVLYEIRQFGLTLFWYWTTATICFGSAFFFLFFLLQQGTLGEVIEGIVLLSGFLILLRTWIVWRKTVCYITNQRLIDVDQNGFFKRTVSEIPFDTIHDVIASVHGFWGTLLQYGTVTIVITGGRSEIILHHIRKPIIIQHHINRVREQRLHKEKDQDFVATVDTILGAIDEFDLEDSFVIYKALKQHIIRLRRQK